MTVKTFLLVGQLNCCLFQWPPRAVPTLVHGNL